MTERRTYRRAYSNTGRWNRKQHGVRPDDAPGELRPPSGGWRRGERVESLCGRHPFVHDEEPFDPDAPTACSQCAEVWARLEGAGLAEGPSPEPWNPPSAELSREAQP